MNKEDIELLWEVQRNTEMAMLAIDTIAEKVDQDDMSYQLEKQNLVYSNMHDRVIKKLLEANVKPEKSNLFQQTMLKMGIHMNTLLDTSVSHIADLLIRGNSRGITSLCRVSNKQKNIKYLPRAIQEKQFSYAMETAQELMNFEENCIEKWRTFL